MKQYPADLADLFRQEIEGEVRFDTYSKILYSTDASVWQMEPIGIVIPKHAEDVAAIGRVVAKNKVPVLPRGGATSLSGQTVGNAVHIDFAKYMHHVLELNTEEQWVRVQPGVIQDHLNNYLRPHGFGLGPDTSSSSRATLGGMTGNNSAGSHSIIHGKMIDHVLEVKTVTDAAGQEHMWAQELAAALIQRQNPDGSWSNPIDRWWEADPILATSYALQTLNICYQTMED